MQPVCEGLAVLLAFTMLRLGKCKQRDGSVVCTGWGSVSLCVKVQKEILETEAVGEN